MSILTNYSKLQIGSHLFRLSVIPKPTELWLALFTTMPDEDGLNGTEVSAPSYSRIQIGPSDSNWGVPVGDSGEFINNVAFIFNTPAEDWGTIVGYGIYDESNNYWFSDVLDVPTVVEVGDLAPSFNVGDLSITFS